MADLVRVRLDGVEKNVGAAYAESHDLEVIDEPIRDRAGQLRRPTRVGGRKSKPRTSVAKKAAEKKKAAVIESAPTDEEQNR